MKILIVGGTGIISAAVTKKLSEAGHELTLINRGSRPEAIPEGTKLLKEDISDIDGIKAQLSGRSFDAVADFISFVPENIDRAFDLFSDKTRQYIFISSGAAFQCPRNSYLIHEDTQLKNPYWTYAQNKILCEDELLKYYRYKDFPVTIVRPGHTYDERWVPLGLSGDKGCYQVLTRMLEGKPTIIHGDGTSLWSLTHNSDFAEGFCGLVGNPHAIGEIVNIATDEVLTWNQIYESIADALGVSLNPFYVSSEFLHAAGPYDFRSCLTGERAQSTVISTDKLKRLVPGFSAKVRFHDGVKRTIDHIFATPSLQVPDPQYDRFCDLLVAKLTETANSIRREMSM